MRTRKAHPRALREPGASRVLCIGEISDLTAAFKLILYQTYKA
jgi:hypothetical protein